MTVSRAYRTSRRGAAAAYQGGARRTQLRSFVPRGTERAESRYGEVNLDLAPREVQDAWTYASNFRARGGLLERCGGFRYVAEATQPPPNIAVRYALHSNRLTLPWFITLLEDGKVYASNGETHHNITPGSGWAPANNTDYSGGVLNGVFAFNNPVDEPHTWDFITANPATPLPGWPSGLRCKTLRSHRSHLFALAVEESGTEQFSRLRWSDAADPGNIPDEWDPTPTNEAGDADLAGTAGNIIDGRSLRDSFIVYKQHATYSMQFVGGQFIYVNRILFPTTGVLARNQIAAIRGWHCVLADGDVIMHDGLQARSMVDGRLRRWIFRQIDSSNVDYARLEYYPSLQELWVLIPNAATEEVETVATWDLDRDKWSVRSLAPRTTTVVVGALSDTSRPQSWDADAEAWNDDPTSWLLDDTSIQGQMIGFDAEGRWMGFDLELNNAGVNFDATLQRAGLDLGLPEQRKTVTRLWPRVTGDPELVLRCRIGAQDNDNAPIAWGPVQEVSAATEGRLDQFVTGRLIAVEIVAFGAWRTFCEGFDLEYRVAGDA